MARKALPRRGPVHRDVFSFNLLGRYVALATGNLLVGAGEVVGRCRFVIEARWLPFKKFVATGTVGRAGDP